MKNENSALLIIGVIIVGILLYDYGYNFAIISYGDNIIEQTKTINCLGTSCELTAPYFGSLTSGSTIEIDGITPSSGGWNIFGDNNGKITISNNYGAPDDELTLTSSISAIEKGGSGNYIQAEITLPPGRLTGKCTLSNSIAMGKAISSCEIQGIGFSFINQIQENSASTSCGVCPRSGCACTITKALDVEITEPTTIIVKLISTATGTVQSVSANAKIELDFEKSGGAEPECTIDSDCGTGFICENEVCVLESTGNGNNSNVIYQDCNTLGCPAGYDCINDVCIKETVEVIEKDCNTLGCPAGYSCINNLCVEQYQPTILDQLKDFFEENFLLSIIIIGFGLIFIWMVSNR